MTSQPHSGTDFWATLGLGEDGEDQDAQPAEEPAAPPTGTPAPAADDPWTTTFATWEKATGPGASSVSLAPVTTGHAPPPATGDLKTPPPTAVTTPTVTTPSAPKAPVVVPPSAPRAQVVPPDPDTGWREAEEIAAALRGAGDPAMPSVPRLRETLLRCADGNETLADMIRDVLTGWHLLGPLWRDDRVTEIHVRGVRVTALGIGGVHELADFPDPGSARAAVETVTRAAADVGAVVTAVGGFTVVRRRDGAHPDAGSLVAEGVMEAELLSRVADAIERMRAVTVTGPAAPRITLTLASLIPAGSRVFQGPFGRLPAGCVAVAGPLEADYVTGTRPGEPAEGMAAGGQIGAVIANPETDIPAQVRLAVTGRTAAPTRVTAR